LAVQVPPESAARAGPGVQTLQFKIVRQARGGLDEAQVVEKSTFVIPR
jgi:hypothetical protein